MLSTPVPSAWIHFSFGASRTTWSAIGGEKHKQHVGVGDIGADIVMMADDIDGELRKAFKQHRLVARLHRFLDFAEDQNVCHGAGI